MEPLWMKSKRKMTYCWTRLTTKEWKKSSTKPESKEVWEWAVLAIPAKRKFKEIKETSTSKSTESIYSSRHFTTWTQSLYQINAVERTTNTSWWWRIISFLKSKRSWMKWSTKFKQHPSMEPCTPERSTTYMATPRKTRWRSSCKSAKVVKELNRNTKSTCLIRSRLFNFRNRVSGLVSLTENKARYVFMIPTISKHVFS